MAVKVWQNARQREDVNGDGYVVPIDALIIVNDINANGSRPLPLPPAWLLELALDRINNQIEVD